VAAPPPPKDPEHWLFRLTAEEWLAAADNELRLCAAALARRAARPAVTRARRAAGMAWNAVLAHAPDDRFGRSYMEHILALAADERLPEEVRAAAGVLRDTAPVPPVLVKIGRPEGGDEAPLLAARTVVEHARRRTTRS